MKVVIAGGVAGGATAAARIRRLDEQAEIIVFERSGYISYANCGLPYYIGDVITDPDDLTLQTPESFWKRFRIAMKVHHEVTAIHPERKAVTVQNLETGAVFDECYDKLLLSPGAQPTQPKLPKLASTSCLPCARWRIPSGSRNISINIIPNLLFWLAADLSVWSWLKTCARSVWMSPSFSAPSN